MTDSNTVSVDCTLRPNELASVLALLVSDRLYGANPCSP